MQTWIALLRGINVGGKNILPMKELATLLEGLDCEAVKTYIQSGNVVFKHNSRKPDQLQKDIQSSIEKSFGFEPKVLLLKEDNFNEVLNKNPFPEAIEDPKSLHVFFLVKKTTKPDLEKLESLKNETERFVLLDNSFFLHAPDGVGRSKLFEKVEKALGVSVTARNWRTVQKISDLIKQI